MPRALTPNAARAGRTLAELLVAITVSGIFFALVTAAFIGHDRLTARSAAIAEMRAHARQAQEIVPALLAAAPAADFHSVSDTLVDFDYTIASAVACLDTPPTQLLLAPDSIAAGQRFASWTHVPRPGDLAHIFDPGPHPGMTDDRWWTATVTGLSVAPNACASSPLLDPVADATHQAHVAGLAWSSSASPAAIATGAVVRFTRRTRASLYAASGRDYLGLSDFDPTTARWSVIQPVSGPYASLGTRPGIQFLPLDSLGARIATGSGPINVAALTLNIGVRSATRIRIPGMSGGLRAESLSAHIALRSR